MKMGRRDIMDEADIRLMVDTFYGRVRGHETLGPIFESKIGDNWDRHLAIMYGFWSTLLFGKEAYKGSPFLKHMDLPVDASHFESWVALFTKTVQDLFEGEKADDAIKRAKSIATVFETKIRMIRENNAQFLK